MFARLFAESGLSLDRLKSLLEVGVAGSIAKAADGDPVRQSQYSRQIKELEDFFHARLIERQGKGTRLTSNGRELARLARFFMQGLSNFQRGCLAEEQTFRIGASATFIQRFLLPVLASRKRGATYVTEVVAGLETERRLHDLTLDFAILTRANLSRPLQTQPLGQWKLALWVPKAWRLSEAAIQRQFQAKELPLALARSEMEELDPPLLAKYPAQLVCDNFLEAAAALQTQELAAFIPDFVAEGLAKAFVRVDIPEVDTRVCQYCLAWNPRLFRLNPHAIRQRDWLAGLLGQQMTE